MNYYSEEDIRRIVESVVSRCAAPSAAPRQAGAPDTVPVEVSARHVHLTREAVRKLFGPDHQLVNKRALSQPGEFLSEDRVKIVTAKGTFDNVAVLGPERSAVQVELSAQDCRALGIDAPLRLSGNLDGAADVLLIGPAGILEARGSAIIALAHVHMTEQDAARMGIKNGEALTVRLDTERPTTVRAIARVKQRASLALHIDFDEANAAMVGRGVIGTIVKGEDTCARRS
ncbi:MAG: propanediol utilization protein [Clostridia bacterium]|nr:propanediol utilization protein [Clostridia bacterium]